MTVTGQPHDPRYLDEKDVRDELTRVFSVCDGCRRCTDLCGVFPTLFELIGRHDASGSSDVRDRGRDPGRLTPAEQDRVVDACLECGRCAVACPYLPDRHEAEVDVPRLMVRALAMRRHHGQVPVRAAATAVAVRPDRAGRLAGRAASVANHTVAGRPGSLVRRALQPVTGISRRRLLPPLARERFSTWFRRREDAVAASSPGPGPGSTPGSGGSVAVAGSGSASGSGGSVAVGGPGSGEPRSRSGEAGTGRGVGPGWRAAVFPTCLVEHHEPAIGRDAVAVLEHNGLSCSLASAACCGAPLLHGGDTERFAAVVDANLGPLAAAVRDGRELVVLQPTCARVLTQDYPLHCSPERRDDARLVAAHAADAVDFLMDLHGRGRLDTTFPGEVPDAVTYHEPCGRRALQAAAGDPGATRGAELLALTGARVNAVSGCAGTGGAWGLRPEHAAAAIDAARHLVTKLSDVSADDPLAGDCHLANTAIFEQSGRSPVHPIRLIARAYGIPEH